jgi:hypothetical protein
VRALIARETGVWLTLPVVGGLASEKWRVPNEL